MRIDKLLCDMNYGTRKQVKEHIKNGLVHVNGVAVVKPEFHVDVDKDEIKIGGKVISFAKNHYYMLNKPQGVISSTEKGPTETVIDILADENIKGLAPVGRLDKDTEGLLLITDDGKLAHNLLSPKKHVDKTYEVHLSNKLSEADIEQLEKGVDIGDEKMTLPAKVEVMDMADDEGRPVIHLTIHEGRFHQVKRMLEAVGNEVLFLKRLSMGSLVLDENLEPGEYRELTAEELSALRNKQ